jgi:hypothetical protein
MPLLDLLADPLAFKYESKTRKFGMDMPGGGDSGLPYIQFPPDNGTTSDPFATYYKTNRTSLDFPIRGGGLVSVLGENAETPSSKIDKDRIEKFLKSKPKGSMFLLKQTGLQLSNPKTQTGDATYKAINNNTPGIFSNTQIYNDGKNTLAQVGVQGTGAHISRIGTVINNINEKYYADVVGAELTMDPEEALSVNRLSILADLKLRQSSGYRVSTNLSAQSVAVDKLGISLIRDRLFDYLGGPGSVYGIGTTVIKRATDTSEAVNYELPGGVVMSNLTYTYSQLMDMESSRKPQGSPITNHTDFRSNLAGFSEANLDRKNMIGFWWADGQVDVKFFDGRVDKMNKLAPYNLAKGENPFKTTKDPNGVNKGDKQDIIKFAFECLSNSNIDTDNNTILLFRAYLSGITDNNTAAYNGFKYMGRGENFYVYQGFDRSISFSFKIAIGSHEELDASYKKLNYLISQVYPDYNKFTNFMTSPIIRLTIGDYLYRVHGFLESVNVTVDQNSSWEITDGEQLPHVVDVAISFKPILSELPRRGNPLDATDVPNIIRQTDANEYKNEVFIPKAPEQPTTNTNASTIPPLIAAPSIIPSALDPNSPAYVNPLLGTILGSPLGFGTNALQSPATKTATAVKSTKAAVAKTTATKKATATKGKTTTATPKKQTGPTVAAAQTKVTAPKSPLSTIVVKPSIP